MPITRINNKIIYFAHVPKCGGTTVEKAFEAAGFKWVMHKGRWKSMGRKAYVRSMPTHINATHLEMLFPGSFIDVSFAVVRHPLSRFLSAFNYNRLTGRIPWYVGISSFLSKLEKSEDRLLFKNDNHFLTADEIVPNESKIFRLEDGLSDVAPWLAEAVGDEKISLDFAIENKKKYNDPSSSTHWKKGVKSYFQPKVPEVNMLSEQFIDRVHNLFKCDFDRFGYDRLPE